MELKLNPINKPILKTNLKNTLYLIIGCPGCGKTTYRNKLQKTHADKSINFMAWSDTIANYVADGLSQQKAGELVTMLTESNIANKYEIYVLEDVPEISVRTRLCAFAESQGYTIIIVNFLLPQLIKENKIGEYVDWFWSIKNPKNKYETSTNIPKNKSSAMVFIKNYLNNFNPISKEEQDNYRVIITQSYSDTQPLKSGSDNINENAFRI